MDRSLVERASRGDIDAFEELIRSRMPSVYRLSLSVLGSEHDAADATQETFVSAWRGLSRLRDPDRFDAWLKRINVNACREVFRRRARVREIRLVEAGPDRPGDADSDRHADIAWLDAAFTHLSVEERALITLHHLEGRELREIASILEVPVGTVKSRLWAARRNLERALIREKR